MEVINAIALDLLLALFIGGILGFAIGKSI